MTIDFAELIKKGALLIDLRTKAAFEEEHISGSLNIPFDSLKGKLLKSNFGMFRKNETMITCSDNATESTAAKVLLESEGIKTVYDGGDWKKLKGLVE